MIKFLLQFCTASSTSTFRPVADMPLPLSPPPFLSSTATPASTSLACIIDSLNA
jgi:hypothetical protein